MSQRYRRGLKVLLGVVAFTGFTLAGAQELPPRQPGLWKHTQYEGKSAQETEVVYQCADQASDAAYRETARKMASCTEEPVQRKGGTLAGRNTCEVMGSRVTTEYVISGDMKTEYRIESRSTHEPPLFGVAQSETVVVAQWQGPCRPGQKPGDMIIAEDGEVSSVSLEQLNELQEMSKSLEQMQSSQGMGQMLEMLQKVQPQGGGADMQKLSEQIKELNKMLKPQR